MKKIIFALMTTAGALGAVSAAHAEDMKPYVGVGAVSASHKYDLSNDTSTGDRKSNEWGGKIYGGLQLDKTFGVEAGYTDFGKSGYGYSVGSNSGRVDSHAKSFYLAGTARMPVNQQLAVVGKLGLSHNQNDVIGSGLAAGATIDDAKTAIYAGVGAEYAINQNVSLTADYEHYGKNETSIGRRKGAVSVGAKFNF